MSYFCVCVPSPRVPSQKTDGGTELIQFQNGERTSKLYLSKPTWYERQTFYARTARATLINFGAKVIVNCVWIYVSGVSEFTWSMRQDDYNVISVSPCKIDIKPTLFLWILYQFFSDLLITSKSFLLFHQAEQYKFGISKTLPLCPSVFIAYSFVLTSHTYCSITRGYDTPGIAWI